jgi:hypothetical protein
VTTWSQAGPATPSIIDLTDSRWGLRPQTGNPPGSSSPDGQPRDAKGKTFADHLVAELRRRPA